MVFYKVIVLQAFSLQVREAPKQGGLGKKGVKVDDESVIVVDGDGRYGQHIYDHPSLM